MHRHLEKKGVKYSYAEAIISTNTLAGTIIWTGILWNAAQWALEMISQGIYHSCTCTQHHLFIFNIKVGLTFLSMHLSQTHITSGCFFEYKINALTYFLSGSLCCCFEAGRVGFMNTFTAKIDHSQFNNSC
jgi:hypothetical protein